MLNLVDQIKIYINQ